MPKYKKFHATYKEAKKELEKIKSYNPHTSIRIYDLKKSHPRRVKTRYLVGNYFDWLEL